MAVGHAAGGPRDLRLAADRDMLLEIALRQVGHGRAAGELRRERQGNRFLPGLDARDDERRPLARLLGPNQRVAPDRYSLLPVRPPRLGDIDLAAGRMDPDPEPLDTGRFFALLRAASVKKRMEETMSQIDRDPRCSSSAIRHATLSPAKTYSSPRCSVARGSLIGRA